MSTVLVTGVGGIGGSATVRTLLEHTDHEIVGVDANPASEGFYFLDHHAVVPLASDPEWVDAVLGVVDQYGVDAIVPLVDEELLRLPELYPRLPDGVVVVAPRPAVVRDTLDKYRMARRLEAAGLAVPETQLVSELDDYAAVAYPVIVKPRQGHGSRGVERVDSPEELETYLACTTRSHDELLVQACIEGPEFTTSIVATTDDRLLGIVPKEVLEKRGNTVRGVTRAHEGVMDACEQLFELFLPGGPINVQQMVDETTGVVYTIEINPRFSSTACLTVDAGVDELDLLVRDALGEAVVAPPAFKPGVHLIRYTASLFVDESLLPVATPEHAAGTVAEAAGTVADASDVGAVGAVEEVAEAVEVADVTEPSDD